MWTFLLLAAAIAGWWHHRRRPAARRSRHRTLQRTTTALRHIIRRRPQHGAGASAHAHARHLRTRPRNLIAAAVGITTKEHRLANRYEAGAEGERHTAALLAPLSRRGSTILHDLALPTGQENVDHLVISPTGIVFLPDSKQWSRCYPLAVRDGRLWHGRQDVTGRLSGLAHGARTVSAVLGVSAMPIVVVRGAPLYGADGRPTTDLALAVDGLPIWVVPADRIMSVLRSIDPSTTRTPAARNLATRARRHFPPHTLVHH